jgi:hypothetical protein
MTNCYFSLTKEKPKLQKLKNLLEMNLYMGKALDQNIDAKRVKYRVITNFHFSIMFFCNLYFYGVLILNI